MSTRIALAAVSLFACTGDGGDLPEIVQREAQQVVDSFDTFDNFGLEFGPAIAVSAGVFANGGAPPGELNVAISGLLEMLNPCLDGIENNDSLTITWGIRDACLAGGIEHGIAELTTRVDAGQVTIDVVDTAPLLLNGTSFAQTMTMAIDPAVKTASITRSVSAFRGAGADADQLEIDETGTAVLDNTALPFMTYNLQRSVTFNGTARAQIVTDVVFVVKKRLPRSGKIHVDGIEEGGLDLVFAADEAGAVTIDATLAKGGVRVGFPLGLDGDTIVLE